jgi:hypothetical protein
MSLPKTGRLPLNLSSNWNKAPLSKSSRLWRDSFQFDLPATLGNQNSPHEAHRKAVKIVKLGKEATPLVKPHFGNDEAKDFSWLYSAHYEWVVETLAIPTGGSNERGN